jgi:hypothetical protein
MTYNKKLIMVLEMRVTHINVTQTENHMSEQLPPYIRERLDDQISWYEKKSSYHKLRFRICQLIVIVESAVISIINLGIPLFGSDPFQALGITAILGIVITIVTALSQVMPTLKHGYCIELRVKL